MRLEYPTSEKVIKFNKESIEKIKIKKADRHKVLSHIKLDRSIGRCKKIKGDAYDKGACLLKNLIKEHPFASGNRRTAFITTKYFLLKNNKKFKVKNHNRYSRTFQGIREDYYKDKEIKNWFKNGKIRRFERG